MWEFVKHVHSTKELGNLLIHLYINYQPTRVYPKVPGLSHKEINNDNNKHSSRSNTNDYGGKTH
jgi:hypothetical protein